MAQKQLKHAELQQTLALIEEKKKVVANKRGELNEKSAEYDQLVLKNDDKKKIMKRNQQKIAELKKMIDEVENDTKKTNEAIKVLQGGDDKQFIEETVTLLSQFYAQYNLKFNIILSTPCINMDLWYSNNYFSNRIVVFDFGNQRRLIIFNQQHAITKCGQSQGVYYCSQQFSFNGFIPQATNCPFTGERVLAISQVLTCYGNYVKFHPQISQCFVSQDGIPFHKYFMQQELNPNFNDPNANRVEFKRVLVLGYYN